MESTSAAVLGDTVVALDAVLRSGTLSALAAGDMMELLRVAGEIQRRVEAVVVEAVANVDQRPAGSGEPAFCGRFGCRSMNELLQRVLRVDAATAARTLKAARLVRREVDLSSGEWLPARWPALRDALVEGAIGVTGLLAATGPIEQGALLPEVAGQLQRIWDAYLNPKVEGPPVPGVHFVPSADLDDASAGDLPVSPEDDALPSGDAGGMVDGRTRAQKQHDALAAALGIAARHDDMPRLGGGAPTLVVTVAAEDFARGRGWAQVEGVGTPVSTRVAVHTDCGGTVQRVVFGAGGRIIGLGSSERIFTTAQRRAICARDRECLIPGCHVPAAWCEIHHVTEHARGGATHTDNGVALCWHHHRTLDTSGWQIRMRDGVPLVRGPAWWDPARRWRTPPPRGPRPGAEPPHARRARILRAETSAARSATSVVGGADRQ
ncbi:HNH endonuclease signature motif containing protein [Microbacterium sp. K35]|uniref:HNH endonuclease signature motif containing protein n=1 Tax=Microbacterium sp. K35 TaxID=2305440 RepID=UPI00109BB129|nr:HNH endonuclease signature motif containing protein [Microbacterium sp. K35]